MLLIILYKNKFYQFNYEIIIVYYHSYLCDFIKTYQ